MSTNAKTSALQYTDANYDTLAKVFSSHPDLKSFITWHPQWSEAKQKWLKRPVQAINNPLIHLSLQKAAASSSHVGLVCNDLHNLIAIDIDGVDTSTPSLAKLLKDHPTYTELSPSGKPFHLRLLYSLRSIDDKYLMKHKGSFKPADQPNKETHDLELYNLSTNFVTLTGQHVPGTPLSISEISHETIIEHFPTFAPRSEAPIIDITTRLPQQPTQQSTAILTPYATWLNEVPCDRSDPALIAFMGKHSLIYHDYWLLGMMAIHAAFGAIQGYSVADSWSKSSLSDYDAEEVAQRWTTISDPSYVPDIKGLPRAQTSVTAGTYQWMFNEFSIDWPVLKGTTKVPKPDELQNFQAFLSYKGLTPEVDTLTGVPFLDGADYALYPTYYPSKSAAYAVDAGDLERLSILLVLEAQPYKFRPTSGQVYIWLKDLILTKTTTINRFAREVDNLPLYDPDKEPDYIKMMSTEIIQRNVEAAEPTQEFQDILVKKWLLSLGRSLWTSRGSDPTALPATSEGVLILSSPLGGINKSSFGIRLFPPEWRHLHICTKPRLSGQFADKDSVQKTIGKLIVDFDEAERIFSHNDTADLKAYLTERYDIFRPPYGRDTQKHNRGFSCLASTNLTDLVFPREGARRYWWLNVSYVDTYTMDTMNMYNLWRQIKWELEMHTGKRAAYILNKAESKYLEGYLVEHTSTNGIEETLHDIYDFSPRGFDKYTKEGVSSILQASSSITEISDFLATHTKVPMNNKAIKYAITSLLKQCCPTFRIGGTVIKAGCHVLRRQHRFFMPEPRMNFAELDNLEDIS